MHPAPPPPPQSARVGYSGAMPEVTDTPAQTAETTPAATPTDGDAPAALDADLLAERVEAIVLSNPKPVTAARIAEVISALAQARDEATVEPADVDRAVESLNRAYDETGRAFRIEPVAGGYRVMTRAAHADVLAAFHRKQASSRLSRPAIETLAIIAYKQPITRAKLEAIRGVGCGEVLRSLLERRLIAVTGRAEELGRPMLYGTTKQFLDSFGIRSVKDLPSVESMLSAQGEPA
jgi:segregation and condensation protein B